MRKLKMAGVFLGLGLMIGGFQNCGQTSFTSSAATSSSDLNHALGVSTDSNTSTDVSKGNNTSTDNQNSDNQKMHGSCDHMQNVPQVQAPEKSVLVECQLVGGPKVAVSSGAAKAQASNSASERVCMSENACLNLMNAYAKARGCSLSSGAATTPSADAQCTQVFPGSQGTCNNASAMADSQVVAMLLTMGQ